MRAAVQASTRAGVVRRTRAAALLLAGTTILGGGTDADGDEAPVNRDPVQAASMDAMLDRLPSDTIEINTLDLVAAKRKLGLPGDADPSVDSDRPPAQETLNITAGIVLSKLAGSAGTKVEPIADLRRVTAAVQAPNYALDSVVLLATRQPRAEIERVRAPTYEDVEPGVGRELHHLEGQAEVADDRVLEVLDAGPVDAHVVRGPASRNVSLRVESSPMRSDVGCGRRGSSCRRFHLGVPATMTGCVTAVVDAPRAVSTRPAIASASWWRSSGSGRKVVRILRRQPLPRKKLSRCPHGRSRPRLL